jgi:glycosyltransferase involved in cell wall biosynthesis
MKVVIVTPYFYPEVGGLEQYVLSIARGLVDRFGWQVWVITSDKRKKLLETEVIKGIRVVRLHTSLIVSNTPVGFFGITIWLRSLKH